MKFNRNYQVVFTVPHPNKSMLYSVLPGRYYFKATARKQAYGMQEIQNEYTLGAYGVFTLDEIENFKRKPGWKLLETFNGSD